MVQTQTRLKVADNSGAKEVMIIRVFGSGNKSVANVGDIVKVTVKMVTAGSMIKKGQIHRAVIVATKVGITRKTGEKVAFDGNYAVLIKADNNPLATRIMKPIAREVKEKGFNKIASLAPEIY